MKIALLLSTAFGATKSGNPVHDRRVHQYVSGLQQIAELVNSWGCFDVFSVDNTVDSSGAVDSRVMASLNKIVGLKRNYHFLNNDVGKINKGSGLITQWNHVLTDLLGSYEYIVHYEPRQYLIDYSFFERIIIHPDAYFCVYRDHYRLWPVAVDITLPRFWTGLFSMRTLDLLGYVQAGDRRVPTSVQYYRRWRYYRSLRFRFLPGWISESRECIESDLLRYVRRHNIPIVRLPSLGARWHNEAKDDWVDMVDRDFSPALFQ